MAKKWHQLERLDHKALKKLQQERAKAAKAAQEAAKKKQAIIIGISAIIALTVVLFFIYIIRSKAQAKAIKEAREALKVSKVVMLKGKVDCRDIGIWKPTKKQFKFSKAYSFKTDGKSMITVQLKLKNQLKLFPNSEMRIFPPELEKKEIKIKSEHVELKNGELTVSISLDGQDLLDITVGKIKVKASSGLFKIIYDKMKDKGEVVVKNGVVTVMKARAKSGGVKVTGFYKVMFNGNKIKNPTQASVIQYNWR